jgi:hypothetical protein
MVFLVGARRSGTNWLQRILCAHPDVAAIPSETYLFRQGIEQLAERFHQSAPRSTTTGFVYMERSAMLDALRDFCDAVFMGVLEVTAPKAVRLVERTPDHVRHLPLIGEIYPDARFIHIIRDGRDVVRSLLSQSWGPTAMEDAAEEWRSAIVAGQEAGPGLPHYREVRYEELLADPGKLAADLTEWLGLDAAATNVDAAVLEAGILINVDERNPAAAEGKWRESLSGEDLSTFMRIAGPTLVELGYETSPGKEGDATGPRRTRRRDPSSLRRMIGRRSSPDRGEFAREAMRRAKIGQHITDRVLACLASQRFAELSDLMDPSAYVRVVAPPDEWEGRGPAAFVRLTEHLAADQALKGSTVRGDLLPSLPTTTAIMSYRLPDGSTEDRMVSVTVEEGRITRLTYYRLPLHR